MSHLRDSSFQCDIEQNSRRSKHSSRGLGLASTQFNKIYSKDTQVKFTNFPITDSLEAIKQIIDAAFRQLSYIKHVTRQASNNRTS
ncbi:hypothetical protein CSPX01_17213 [Colletotrichum filicis]|nr:hypothetical protein CSPX01_17213 [Colletotrichum filicis]